MADMYKHKSGRAKRKEKEKKDAESKKGQKTLESFMKKPRLESDTTEPHDSSDSDDDALREGTSHEDVNEGNLSSQIDPQRSRSEPDPPDDYTDIGCFSSIVISPSDIEKLVQTGPMPQPRPEQIENDSTGKTFPFYVFSKKLANGEIVKRDYLSFSLNKHSMYCFPCRLFHQNFATSSVASLLSTPQGSTKESGYQRLYKLISRHENSISHRQCYIEWKKMESRLKHGGTVESLLQKDINDQVKTWREILKRILDVITFLGERGLPFLGDTERLGNPHNGNFLGIIELLSNYDPILKEHLGKVRQAQSEGKRLQTHYLSSRTQNEFIKLCGNKVRQAILDELKSAKYYSFMVDGTPDVSCHEQATFVFRYLHFLNGQFKIKERFFTFVDDNGKTGD